MFKKLLKFISKISVRLLLFNVLLVIIPVAFLFYLDTYENKLLSAQEHAMVQQGRIMSSALKNSGVGLEDEANRVLNNLNKRQEARIRVVDSEGKVLVDSSLIGLNIVEKADDTESRVLESKGEYIEAYPKKRSNDRNFLYSLVRAGLDLVRYFLRGPKDTRGAIEYYSGKKVLDGVEIQAALNGRYGATTRISTGGQRSITMYSAIPIYNDSEVNGVVLISQSTYRILQNLYQIRLEIFKVFLICLAASLVISFILSSTIAGPLKKLRNQAKEIIDNRGRLTSHFKRSGSMDEIGDLNESLLDLTKKLHSHLLKTESFASDVSHEFKNPLASIQAATELLKDSDNVDVQEKFVNIISQETQRLERLISGVREISGIDVKLSEEDRMVIDPDEIIESVVTRFRMKHSGGLVNVVYENSMEEPVAIEFNPERFIQVLENIIDNAISFSPENGIVSVTMNKEESTLKISITDEGPGIPEENIEKIFNRFFTYRPENASGNRNSGLGLSICDVIVQGYGGSIAVKNRSKGVLFKVCIPIAKIKVN